MLGHARCGRRLSEDSGLIELGCFLVASLRRKARRNGTIKIYKMMTAYSTEQLLSLQYDVLGHSLVEASITELRRFRPAATQAFARGKEDFLYRASASGDGDNYVGINPRTEERGSVEAIGYLTCLVIDIDPVRPKDSPSTDEQHRAALDLAERIRTDLKCGINVSSGSGSHLYVPINPIKVTNAEVLTESLKTWMEAIRSRYATPELKVDSIFDLPRVIRVWGSLNTRSNRICGPLENVGPIVRSDFNFNQETISKAPTPGTESGRFESLIRSNKRLSDIVAGNISYPSRSESDFEFVRILCEAHFSVEEIEAVMGRNPHGTVANPKPGDKASDILRDIKGIAKKVLKENQSNSKSLVTHSGAYYSSLRNRSMGILSGLGTFDELVSGLKRQKLYILGARPTTGKTTLLTQILVSIAEAGNTCLFYPTEVGADPIFDKIVSAKTGLDLKKFQNGTFTETDYEKIESVKPIIESIPLIVVEDFATTVDTVEQGIKKYAPAVVAVDFFQALKWEDPESVGEKSGAVRKLKELAGDYNIPIILASQLNRSDDATNLKALKGTGTLEELGDVICFMYRDSQLTYPVKTTLSIKKSKYSAIGDVPLDFYSSVCRFEEEKK